MDTISFLTPLTTFCSSGQKFESHIVYSNLRNTWYSQCRRLRNISFIPFGMITCSAHELTMAPCILPDFLFQSYYHFLCLVYYIAQRAWTPVRLCQQQHAGFLSRFVDFSILFLSLCFPFMFIYSSLILLSFLFFFFYYLLQSYRLLLTLKITVPANIFKSSFSRYAY